MLLTESWYPVNDYRVTKEKWMRLSALAKAAQMCGAMGTCLELTVAYVQEREQFGRSIVKFQAVQQQLALLAGHVLSATTMVNNAIGHLDSTLDTSGFDIAATKLRVSELTREVTQFAHQIHAAIGVTYEHSLHQYTRRLWAWCEQFGNEAYWEDILAQLIQQSETDIWSYMTKVNGKGVMEDG